MPERARRASVAAAATAGPGLRPRPDTAAPLPPPPPQGLLPPRAPGTTAPRSSRAREAPVQRRSADVAPRVTCGICGGLLRDATVVNECLHAFCRQCIYDKVEKQGIKCCPTCGAHLGNAPKEKLRPDRSLQNIRSVVFPSKRRKVVNTKNKKRKEKISDEPVALSSMVDMVTEGNTAPLPPTASQIEAQNIEIEMIDKADEALVAQESVYESSILNLAPVGRDVLSRIRCRDFYSSCYLSAETGALIVWQPPPVLEEMVAFDQLAPRQDPDTSKPPATSDAEHQRQVPTVQMTNTSVVAGTSFHARMTVHEETLREDILTIVNEGNARIMGRYEAHIRQLKDDGSKLIEKLENEKAAALERTRILEERHQRETTAAAERIRILEERLQRAMENEREAAAEKIRILEGRLQIALSFESRCQSLEAEKAKLYEELENGRAGNKALMSEILKKNDDLTTLKHYSDVLVSDKIDLENKLKHLTKESENAKKEHARIVRQFKDAARAVSRELGNDRY
ncbi:unnamed protein product [Urochloa decumbens]|uniref:RING-type domain-containing protein n=1 Tax=Urochloa decumbens TaxID=240449 RepID=A0ABC9F1M3_9POAL